MARSSFFVSEKASPRFFARKTLLIFSLFFFSAFLDASHEAWAYGEHCTTTSQCPGSNVICDPQFQRCLPWICAGRSKICAMDSVGCIQGRCEGKGEFTQCVYTANHAACSNADPFSCTLDLCIPSGTSSDLQTGCASAPVASRCRDSFSCTETDCDPTDPRHDARGCVTTPVDALCADNFSCTQDRCDTSAPNRNPATGCVSAPNNTLCNDNNSCTDDICTPACRDDSCRPSSGCQNIPVDTNQCSADSNACTADFCLSGRCQTGPAQNCDDGNPCTDDSCDAVTGGCLHTFNAAPCERDGNRCTVDRCSAGVCAFNQPIFCFDDANSCTDISCNPGTGACETRNNSNSCNDGNMCTSGDACSAGRCAGGTSINCDDGNPCTDDSCDPAFGCRHSFNSSPCNDGNACTTGDHCSAGSCTGGSPLACDDGNLCTDDSCHPASGCQNAFNSAPCNDGNACTNQDQCSSGSCRGGPPLACNDGNLCTDDSCHPSSGCQNAFNAAPCNDGNACTTGDHCSIGSCAGGLALACDDGNLCTTDQCNPATGCEHPFNTIPCNDGDTCTNGDACFGGACRGNPLNCNDSQVCTNDSCNGGACLHNPATGMAGCCFSNADCDDGNACTMEHCDLNTHQCLTDLPPPNCCNTDPECNDGNACTADRCLPSHTCENLDPLSPGCSGGPGCDLNTCRMIPPECDVSCPATVVLGAPADCVVSVTNASRGVIATSSTCSAAQAVVFTEVAPLQTQTSATWRSTSVQSDTTLTCTMTNVAGTSPVCQAELSVNSCGVNCLQSNGTKEVMEGTPSVVCSVNAPPQAQCTYQGQTVSGGAVPVATQSAGNQIIEVTCTLNGVAATCSDMMTIQSRPPDPPPLPPEASETPPETRDEICVCRTGDWKAHCLHSQQEFLMDKACPELPLGLGVTQFYADFTDLHAAYQQNPAGMDLGRLRSMAYEALGRWIQSPLRGPPVFGLRIQDGGGSMVSLSPDQIPLAQTDENGSPISLALPTGAPLPVVPTEKLYMQGGGCSLRP